MRQATSKPVLQKEINQWKLNRASNAAALKGTSQDLVESLVHAKFVPKQLAKNGIKQTLKKLKPLAKLGNKTTLKSMLITLKLIEKLTLKNVRLV